MTCLKFREALSAKLT